MLEIGQKLAQGLHDLCFGEVVMGEDVLQLLKEGIDLVHGMPGGLLHNTQSLEAQHVYLLAGNVELLVCFFTSGVGLEVHCGVLQGLTIDH